MTPTEETSLSTLSQQVHDLGGRFDSLAQRLDPILEAYDSVVFGKKFLAGLAAILASIAVIGGAVIASINYIRHG